MRYIPACLILSLAIVAACGSHEPFDINEESDTAVSVDSTASGRDSTDTAPAPTCQGKCGTAYNNKAQCQCDAECVVNKDCCNDYQSQCVSTNCTDGDGDGYCSTAPKQGDCNDNNVNVNPGVPEKCGDNKDNDCDGQADEGCVAPCVATAEVCADSKDNDCDGLIDEGCTAPTGNNTLTVTYPDSAYRRLSYGITPDTSFTDWKPQAWTMNASLSVDLGNLTQSNCTYLRFNVDQPQGWLCMGSSTAVLNSQPTITATLFGQTYNTSSVKTVLKDGGCSAYFLVAKPGASCPTP
jgi:hypothetical protein